MKQILAQNLISSHFTPWVVNSPIKARNSHKRFRSHHPSLSFPLRPTHIVHDFPMNTGDRTGPYLTSLMSWGAKSPLRAKYNRSSFLINRHSLILSFIIYTHKPRLSHEYRRQDNALSYLMPCPESLDHPHTPRITTHTLRKALTS